MECYKSFMYVLKNNVSFRIENTNNLPYKEIVKQELDNGIPLISLFGYDVERKQWELCWHHIHNPLT